VDDSRWFLDRDSDEFEQVSRRVRTDDEEPLLALILELGKLDGVLPCVNDRTVTDPVLAGRVRNLHIVKITLTNCSVKGSLTSGVWLPVSMRPGSAAGRSFRTRASYGFGHRHTCRKSPAPTRTTRTRPTTPAGCPAGPLCTPAPSDPDQPGRSRGPGRGAPTRSLRRLSPWASCEGREAQSPQTRHPCFLVFRLGGSLARTCRSRCRPPIGYEFPYWFKSACGATRCGRRWRRPHASTSTRDMIKRSLPIGAEGRRYAKPRLRPRAHHQ
jgi:hypothetical protein